MNREQRRRQTRKLRGKGLDDESVKKFLQAWCEIEKKAANTPDFAEGDKVKINIKSLMNEPDYPCFTDKYKDWVDAHKDDVFTVEYDERHQKMPVVVCLKEDDSDPKWLFWTGNLTRYDEE